MAYAPPRRASHAPFSVTAGHAARSAGNVVLGRLGQHGELIQNTAFHTRQRKAFRRDFPLRTRTFPWKKSGGKISGTQSEEYIFPKRATVVPPGTASAPRKRQRRKQLIDKNIKRTEYQTNETTDSLRAKKFSGRVNTPYLCLQRCEALMLRKSRSRSQGTRNEPVLATSHPPVRCRKSSIPPRMPETSEPSPASCYRPRDIADRSGPDTKKPEPFPVPALSLPVAERNAIRRTAGPA